MSTKQATPGMPGLTESSLILNGLGIGLSAYGQYQANETARDNYKLNLLQYNDWKKNQNLIQAYNRKQNDLSNTMAFGEYASGLKDKANSTYGNYNASIGK